MGSVYIAYTETLNHHFTWERHIIKVFDTKEKAYECLNKEIEKDKYSNEYIFYYVDEYNVE